MLRGYPHGDLTPVFFGYIISRDMQSAQKNNPEKSVQNRFWPKAKTPYFLVF